MVKRRDRIAQRDRILKIARGYSGEHRESFEFFAEHVMRCSDENFAFTVKRADNLHKELSSHSLFEGA